jgi:hypothetical protein
MPEGELPELARSLRSLGAARDPATQAAHDAIFPPLIAARVRASRAQGRDVVHAFNGVALGEQIERAATAAATLGTTQPAMARSRSARAREALGPLHASFATLDERGRSAAGATPGSEAWEGWVEALRRAFATADEVCGQLARVLAEPPAEQKEERGWFGRWRG